MTACPQCGAALETPLGCEACGALISTEHAPTPFATLGVEPSFRLDGADLRKRLLRFSRLLHPDFYAGRPEEAIAERNTALLNEAHACLADDCARANWLVAELGGPSDKQERSMPQAFLMEVMEWNETLEEARDAEADSPERAALGALLDELTEQRTEALETLSGLLDPLPPSGDAQLVAARQQLNALRYLDRALEQLEELRLDGAANP